MMSSGCSRKTSLAKPSNKFWKPGGTRSFIGAYCTAMLIVQILRRNRWKQGKIDQIQCNLIALMRYIRIMAKSLWRQQIIIMYSLIAVKGLEASLLFSSQGSATLTKSILESKRWNILLCFGMLVHETNLYRNCWKYQKGEKFISQLTIVLQI